MIIKSFFKKKLLPGRKILSQDIDEKFAVLENHGIKKISYLKKCLSTPQKIADFAVDSGISENYLVILKREISNLLQKPVLIASFPDINASLVSVLNDSEMM